MSAMEQPVWRIPASEVARRLTIARALAMPEWKRKRVLELRREGLTYVVIAERLGLWWNTVWKVCARAGLATPRLCSCCGREVGGGPRPSASGVLVCASCKPKWKGRMRLGASSSSKRHQAEEPP